MSSKASRPAQSAGATEQPAAANYEHARDELAQVVATLEAGGLGLEESLTLWERGELLAKQCTAFLDGARERVDAALADADETADTDGPVAPDEAAEADG